MFTQVELNNIVQYPPPQGVAFTSLPKEWRRLFFSQQMIVLINPVYLADIKNKRTLRKSTQRIRMYEPAAGGKFFWCICIIEHIHCTQMNGSPPQAGKNFGVFLLYMAHIVQNIDEKKENKRFLILYNT